MDMNGKVCSDCGEYKAAVAFSRDARTKDGLHGYCKPCSREQARKYRRAHPKAVSWEARKLRIEVKAYRRAANLVRYWHIKKGGYNELAHRIEGLADER